MTSVRLCASMLWKAHEMAFYSHHDRQPNEYADLHGYVL